MTVTRSVSRLAVLFVTAITLNHSAASADEAKVSVNKLTNHTYSLTVQGSATHNLLYADDRGSLLVDTNLEKPGAQFATALKDSVSALLKGKKLNYLVNTHMHDDHAQGNAVLASLGATVIAHRNAATGIKNGYFLADLKFDPIAAAFGLVTDFPPAVDEAVPAKTYDDRLALSFGKERIVLIHPEGAHTDGDTIVYFTGSNVVAMGDIFFSAAMPVIDRDAHGSLDGMIQTCEAILAWINDKTIVVPGHGPVSNKEGLAKFAQMLKTARSRITELAKTQNEDQLVASRVFKDFETDFGGFGPLGTDMFTRLAYRSVKASRR